jgi:hypothetical protein
MKCLLKIIRSEGYKDIMGRLLLYIVVFIIILYVYIMLPRALRFVAFGLNCIIPNWDLYVDEVVIVLGMILCKNNRLPVR